MTPLSPLHPQRKKMPESASREDLLIYGASGHAKVIVDIVESKGKYKIVGIIDDALELWGSQFCGYPVIGGEGVLKDEAHRNCRLILAVGDNAVRKRLWSLLREFGYELACAVHASAQIGSNVFIGAGTVIMANTVLNAGAQIGKNVIINTGATIDHDCVLEDYVHISPGAHLAGNVQVGELTHIGIGVSVAQGVTIGTGAIIGAGTAVVEDIPDDVTAVGVPAKVIKQHREGI